MSASRNWLITGVSSGLGRALSEAVLARGDRVAGSVRNATDAAAFEQLAPGRAHAILMDVTDDAMVRDGVAAVESRHGPIDVLVNNAGYGLVTGVEEASLDEIRHQFDVNVFGAVSVMQAVLPHMRARRRGFIVNITSVSGFVGWASLGIYSGSKFALEGISETLAQELAPLGIRLMMVEPGGLRTDFAGRSRVSSARQIEDYDASVGRNRRILDEHVGHEAGDPRRAAEAIIRAMLAPEPPLRLLLGDDAIAYATAKLNGQLAELESWKPVSTSIAFETEAI